MIQKDVKQKTKDYRQLRIICNIIPNRLGLGITYIKYFRFQRIFGR